MIDSYTVECDMGCHETTTKTNADRIRSMSDEELATYIIKLTEVIRTCDVCEPTYRENGECDCHCENGVLRWLRMEA